ncbi:vesicle transport protein use1 [Anaeramoeba flamelloides]|uniref:Vesicle transport protein use1 n=1 Tax=Anaeramoeba flamelloides TaxID=1746091 RepID=A0ABQ8YR94_9EUKA|nr:vesicle transport protein use1 [Anaeramoeba flamelloides]
MKEKINFLRLLTRTEKLLLKERSSEIGVHKLQQYVKSLGDLLAFLSTKNVFKQQEKDSYLVRVQTLRRKLSSLYQKDNEKEKIDEVEVEVSTEIEQEQEQEHEQEQFKVIAKKVINEDNEVEIEIEMEKENGSDKENKEKKNTIFNLSRVSKMEETNKQTRNEEELLFQEILGNKEDISSLSGDQISGHLKQERKMQEKITNDMLLMVDQLKNNNISAYEILKKDDTQIDRVQETVDTNIEKVDKENVRLDQISRSNWRLKILINYYEDLTPINKKPTYDVLSISKNQQLKIVSFLEKNAKERLSIFN